METLLQDVRFGVRSLAKSRRFTVAAVLTLALGIGANTAMFSVIRSVLLKPWPFRDPAKVLAVTQRTANGNGNVFSTPAFLDWKQQGGLLANMGAFVPWQFNLSNDKDAPERIAGGQVNYDLLETLGVGAAKGRVFSAKDDVAGAGNFVVLSDTLWRTRYSASARAVGSVIELNGLPFTVVGVMPAGFYVFADTELLWTPLQLKRDAGIGASSNVHWLQGFIRLPDGVSLKQAQAELDGVAARLHREDATGDLGFGVQIQTFNDAFTGFVKPALLMLMGCVGFVLLIACSNVANLLLARGAARRREMAVRTALGASPLRVVRQLLTESVLLAFTGGVLGVGLAFAALRGVVAMHPPSVPRVEDVSIDFAVLVFSFAVSVLVGILFGLAPAIEAARLDVNEGLKESGHSTNRGFGKHRSVLVITETALASILLIGTGLALQGLWSLHKVELGFVPKDVTTFRIAAPTTLTGQRVPEFYRQVAERVQGLAGVQSAAVARNVPMSGTDPSMPITTEGKMPVPVQGETVTRYRAVGEDYFRTFQTPVLQGRVFSPQDTATAPTVAIVSESLAKRYWPGESPLGKRLKPNFKGSQWCTVVGMVGDVRHWGADVDIEPTAYYPYTQVPDALVPLLEANMSVAVRSSVAEGALMQLIRGAVGQIDKSVPVYQVQSMDQMVTDAGSLRRFDLSLLGAFSGLALMLATIGVYAVMAYSVAQRTQEIGIRIALGAGARDVLMLILREGVKLALAGVIAGVIAAFLLRRVMANLVYGLDGSSPVIFSVVPLIIVVVIMLACSMPALRATKVDPIVALRNE
jgi:putative ABC transport system permease protein